MIFGLAVSFLFLFEGLRSIAQFIILSFQWKKSQEWLSSQGKIVQSELRSVLAVSYTHLTWNGILQSSIESVFKKLPYSLV